MGKIVIRAVLVAILAFLYSCAAQPARVAETPSGWPQIEISVNDKKPVIENIINRNIQKGWMLEDESSSSLLFSMVDSSGSVSSVLTQAMIGNSYSTPPKYEVRYMISQLQQKTVVVVNVSVSTQMAMGQVNRMSLKDNNQVFNIFQGQLQKIKEEIEQ